MELAQQLSALGFPTHTVYLALHEVPPPLFFLVLRRTLYTSPCLRSFLWQPVGTSREHTEEDAYGALWASRRRLV
jgi:hypothetical protein